MKKKNNVSRVRYMMMALKLAKKGEGKTDPNPMVGAIVVKNNRVVGQGWHRKAGTAHAESIALQKAGLDATSASLYITLEPCAHFGRTPPCVNEIVDSGIKRVYTAMRDPNPVVNGRGVRFLRKRNVMVSVGLCGKEARELNRPYIKRIRKNKQD